MRIRLSVALSAAAILALACAAPPIQEPFQATPVTLGPGELLELDQLLLLVDTSASIDAIDDFPAEKALLQSFVAGMPEGPYQAGAIVFGGSRRHTAALARFERQRLGDHAEEIRHLGESSPLDSVIGEAANHLARTRGRAAVVIFSDGLSTILGTPREPELALAAAQELIERHEGPVCIHTVQTGSESGGEALLEALAGLTECGSYRRFASIDGPAGLNRFQRRLFVKRAPLPPVAAPPPPEPVAAVSDLDGDGVLDPDDACPGTPVAATVDERGCWVLSNLLFESDSFAVDPDALSEIEGVAAVLEANPDLRIRIEGHADSTGSEAYNQRLSEKRADAVKRSLEAAGIEPERLEAQGFGEGRPVASNDTPESRTGNRRIEFTIAR
jgi:OOP family OmpA-OmpF porin